MLSLQTHLELTQELKESAELALEDSRKQREAAQERLQRVHESKQSARATYLSTRESCREIISTAQGEINRLKKEQGRIHRDMQALASVVAQRDSQPVSDNRERLGRNVAEYEVAILKLRDEIAQAKQLMNATEDGFRMTERDYLVARQDLAHYETSFQTAIQRVEQARLNHEKAKRELLD